MFVSSYATVLGLAASTWALPEQEAIIDLVL